jgi:pimeloyl-ACP methyl ester carboxylesterase
MDMADFVLIPGAGGDAWYWHRLVPILEKAGHRAVAVDLPGDDEKAGLADYVERVVDAAGKREVVLVAQSLGGFTAPAAAERVRVKGLVFVNAMIPLPGETAGAWWDNTGSEKARIAAARKGGYPEKFDLFTYFLHDVPKATINAGEKHNRPQSERIFKDSCNFKAWPPVPIHVIAGRDDRFFSLEFQRRVAKERLGKEVDEVDGGHLAALSNPQGLAKVLLGYGFG